MFGVESVVLRDALGDDGRACDGWTGPDGPVRGREARMRTVKQVCRGIVRMIRRPPPVRQGGVGARPVCGRPVRWNAAGRAGSPPPRPAPPP
jgi:hypothetical protein